MSDTAIISRTMDDFAVIDDFMAALLVADHACYLTPEDQVDASRLAYILSLFPQGFRLWSRADTDGPEGIIGYSGWYPIAPAVYHMLAAMPGGLTHRGEIMPSLEADTGYAYLFNYSVRPGLQKTSASRALLRALAADVRGYQLATITVSGDGASVARRFGLSPCGWMGQNQVWA